MNSVYVLLGCAVAVVTLASVPLALGRWAGRSEEHLRAVDEHLGRQDTEIAALHHKLDDLNGGH